MYARVFVFLRQELDQLWTRIKTLEDKGKPAEAELPSLSATSPEDTRAGTGLDEGEEMDTGVKEDKGGEGDEELGTDAGNKEREKATLVIQTYWREHRNRVCNITIMLTKLLMCQRNSM